MKPKEISKELLEEMKQSLRYEKETGKLFWSKNKSSRALAGNEAGVIHETGYSRIGFNGSPYLAHRIIYAMHNEFTPDYIDHIDGNKLNNRIENLRPATHSQNNANKTKLATNTTGVKGVYVQKSDGKFIAQICKHRKIKRIGSFETLEDAAEAYRKAALIYFGEYARLN